MPLEFEDQLTEKGRAVWLAYRKAVAEGRARPVPESACRECGRVSFGRHDLCEPCASRGSTRPLL